MTRFSVADTGRGIRPDDQERLFDAFEQIGGSGARPYEGTGLGLFICQTLAGLIGAAISFETASAMVGDRERIAEAGFDGYIQKPIDAETFIGQVERFLLEPVAPQPATEHGR